jgi:hypothetical protein
MIKNKKNHWLEKKNSSHQTCPKFKGDYFRFGSVFIKKIIKPKLKKKRTETGSN